jgi:hypothetical protein
MRIPDGIRTVSPLAPGIRPANVVTSAIALPHTYPPAEYTGLLLAWLAFTPRPKLPVLEGQRCRQFTVSEVALDPRNQGTFAAAWLPPSQAFLARLSITNDGGTLLPDGTITRLPEPFAGGWCDFAYSVDATTNFMGVVLPTQAVLRRLGPREGAREVTDVFVALEETIRLLEVRPLESTALPPIEPVVVAIDRRWPGLARDRSLNYWVTNDVWGPTNTTLLRSLAAIELHPRPRSSSARRTGFAVLLLAALLGPLLVIWVRRRMGLSVTTPEQTKPQ